VITEKDKLTLRGKDGRIKEVTVKEFINALLPINWLIEEINVREREAYEEVIYIERTKEGNLHEAKGAWKALDGLVKFINETNNK
jgi:hypothetical protein